MGLARKLTLPGQSHPMSRGQFWAAAYTYMLCFTVFLDRIFGRNAKYDSQF